jgi:undecaprenyl-diphosphatase
VPWRLFASVVTGFYFSNHPPGSAGPLPLVKALELRFNAGMPLWISIFILGVIEGITEFLPISSTGHLLIAERWLPRQSDLFNVVIQCGAVIAVIPLFWSTIQRLLLRWRDPETFSLLLKIVVAFGITGVGGIILEKRHFKLPEELGPVAWALLVGGLLFLIAEARIKGKMTLQQISWAAGLLVGIGQLVAAVFPGASRSGTTIILMLLVGIGRPEATEFSFLVGIPTMLAAGGLKIFKALHSSGPEALPKVHENWAMLALGTLTAAVISFIVVKWLLVYVRSHTFKGFGWYRIALGTGLLAWMILSK